MTTTFTDNFTRANEAPISDGGVYGGDVVNRADHRIGVSGNVAVAADSGLGNSGSCYLLQPTSSADCKASLALGSTNSYWEIFVRMDTIGPSFNGYALVGIPSNSVELYIVVAGVSTPVFNVGVGWSAGETWQLRAAGGTLFFDRNGVQQNHFDDATYGSAGLVGFLFGPDVGMSATQFSAFPFAETGTVLVPPPMLGRMHL